MQSNGGFYFKQSRERFRVEDVAKSDPEAMKGDLRLLQDVVKNVTFGEVRDEDFQFVSVRGVGKVVKVMQIALQYGFHTQKVLTETTKALRQENQKLGEEVTMLGKQLRAAQAQAVQAACYPPPPPQQPPPQPQPQPHPPVDINDIASRIEAKLLTSATDAKLQSILDILKTEPEEKKHPPLPPGVPFYPPPPSYTDPLQLKAVLDILGHNHRRHSKKHHRRRRRAASSDSSATTSTYMSTATGTSVCTESTVSRRHGKSKKEGKRSRREKSNVSPPRGSERVGGQPMPEPAQPAPPGFAPAPSEPAPQVEPPQTLHPRTVSVPAKPTQEPPAPAPQPSTPVSAASAASPIPAQPIEPVSKPKGPSEDELRAINDANEVKEAALKRERELQEELLRMKAETVQQRAQQEREREKEREKEQQSLQRLKQQMEENMRGQQEALRQQEEALKEQRAEQEKQAKLRKDELAAREKAEEEERLKKLRDEEEAEQQRLARRRQMEQEEQQLKAEREAALRRDAEKREQEEAQWKKEMEKKKKDAEDALIHEALHRQEEERRRQEARRQSTSTTELEKYQPTLLKPLQQGAEPAVHTPSTPRKIVFAPARNSILDTEMKKCKQCGLTVRGCDLADHERNHCTGRVSNADASFGSNNASIGDTMMCDDCGEEFPRENFATHRESCIHKDDSDNTSSSGGGYSPPSGRPTWRVDNAPDPIPSEPSDVHGLPRQSSLQLQGYKEELRILMQEEEDAQRIASNN